MGHKNKKTLIYQINERYQSMLAIGQSRHEGKKKNETQNKIYSYGTLRAYTRSACIFAKYIKEEYFCRDLDKGKVYINDFLQSKIDAGYSPYTIKLYAAALAKLYGISSDLFIKTPPRKRADIKRSRGDKVRDKYFSDKNNKEYITFCKCTGMRANEIRSMTVSDENRRIEILDGQYFLNITQGTKGGKPRKSLIAAETPEELAIVLNIIFRSNGHIFDKIPVAADTHSYRREYAMRIYNRFARKIKDIPKYERVLIKHNRPVHTYISAGNHSVYSHLPKGYKDVSTIYHCRQDRKNVAYDRLALFEVSANLGHNREEVCAGHYL